jgi:RNA polymerase sigma-70 factor (ECF subfamily)
MDTPHTGSDGRVTNWAETLSGVRAFVAARTGDPELAADLTQDVLVRSIASGALDRVDNPTAWLYRSARNAVIDHYRTRRSHQAAAELERWPEAGRTRQPATWPAASSHSCPSSIPPRATH